MRNKSSKTIETTFGKVTVFNDDDTEFNNSTNKNAFDDFSKSTKKDLNKIIESNNLEENFFGLENFSNSNESNLKEEPNHEDLDFFDEIFFGDLNDKTNNIDNVESLNERFGLDESVKNVEFKNDSKKEMNFFEEHFFGELENKKDSNRSSFNPIKGENKPIITTEEIKNDPDFNYIDQIAFQNQSEFEPFINNAHSLQIKKDETNKNTNEIPIIRSKNLDEDNFKEFNNQPKNNAKNELSNHKLLASEVPKWDHITIDEGAAILKSNICYFNEEQGILAIDKPYGLPSIMGPKVHLCVSKLLPALEKLLKIDYRLLMANRLDQNTTGVMLFSTNPKTANKLAGMFREKTISKQYLAITKFIPQEKSGEIDIPLYRRQIKDITKTYLSTEYNETTKFVLDKPNLKNDNRKNAITKYRVLDSQDKAALLELQPLTGIQHQIRSHLSFGLGCPILGDHKYSHYIGNLPQKLPMEMLKNLKIKQTKVRDVPMHLHSYRILLPEFHNSSNVFITAKLPIHFVNNLKRLKLKF